MGLLVLLHVMYLSNLLDGNLTVTSHPPPTLTKGLLEPRRTEYPRECLCVLLETQQTPVQKTSVPPGVGHCDVIPDDCGSEGWSVSLSLTD